MQDAKVVLVAGWQLLTDWQLRLPITAQVCPWPEVSCPARRFLRRPAASGRGETAAQKVPAVHVLTVPKRILPRKSPSLCIRNCSVGRLIPRRAAFVGTR